MATCPVELLESVMILNKFLSIIGLRIPDNKNGEIGDGLEMAPGAIPTVPFSKCRLLLM